LQINDKLGEGTEEIPLRVRQLRMTNPELGSPITKMELERLERLGSVERPDLSGIDPGLINDPTVLER